MKGRLVDRVPVFRRLLRTMLENEGLGIVEARGYRPGCEVRTSRRLSFNISAAGPAQREIST